jgi:hypothetical protein
VRAVNQDPLGVARDLVWKQGPYEVMMQCTFPASRQMLAKTFPPCDFAPGAMLVCGDVLGLPKTECFGCARYVVACGGLGAGIIAVVPENSVLCVLVCPGSVLPPCMCLGMSGCWKCSLYCVCFVVFLEGGGFGWAEHSLDSE